MTTLSPLCNEIILFVDDGKTTISSIVENSDRPYLLIKETIDERLIGDYLTYSDNGELKLTAMGKRHT